MKVEEFIALAEEDKVRRLQKDGVYIGKCKRQGQHLLLYQLNEFYVEIYYDSYRRHISRFHCFESTEPIDPYLDKMEIGIFV